MRRILKIGGGIVLALAVVVGGGFALGVFGVPSVAGVDNEFGAVNETNTVIYTDLHVNNPNPVGVRLGGVSVNYTVAMNGVDLASGQKDGVAVGAGNSTLNFTTAMDNEQIPAWWYTHVRNDETTTLTIDATATSSTLGQSATFGQEKTIETDIIGQFDSNETRPVDANQPLVSDPVLYINRTRGSWDQQNLTRQRTPLDLDFTVYNPKSVPYTVSKIGYNITMNGVPVGAGETERGYVLEPETTETIRADTAIRNEHLDEWWVSHLERNQVTDLYIDIYLVVEIQGEQLRLDLDSIDYEKRIETDIFGNKPADSGAENTADSTPTPTPTETATDSGVLSKPTDDGVLNESTSTESGLVGTETTDGIFETPSGDSTATATPTPTPTPTPTDDGLLNESTETTDGIL